MDQFTVFPHGRARIRALALLCGLGIAACSQQPATPAGYPLHVPASQPQAAPAAAESSPAAVTDLGQARAAAGDLSLRTDAPLHYVVKRGDTLWAIAGYFLRKPWQWPQLWYENPQIRNPHLIYPGEVLTLVWVGGRPRLTATERLEPRVREESIAQAVPTIPLDAIRAFLDGPRLVDRDTLDRAPAIAAFAEQHLMAGANEILYAVGLPAGAGADWQVLRIGRAYRDPDTDELLGYEAVPVGSAVLQAPGNPAQMLLTKTSREALVGDRLLPPEADRYQADFYPHAPAQPVHGRIISVFDGVAEIGQFQIIAINRGARDGLDVGTVLSILQAGNRVPDPRGGGSVQLLDRPAGIVLVFKVTPKLAYALVMSETQAVHVLDKVAPPVLPGA
ncbi:MAG: LysM peptidoglycan-binding domain-containing protein [Gammaproteobacteria bacterium]|nr:LysM peptidoglycan-binding domain-containing protein [Gammaproteobacteria bacterium]